MTKQKTTQKLSKEDVVHIAKLANLTLTDKDIKKFQEQLSKIVDYVGKLSKANTSKIEPTSQVTGLKNVFREDVIIPSLSQEKILSNAPDIYRGYFKVKAIFEK